MNKGQSGYRLWMGTVGAQSEFICSMVDWRTDCWAHAKNWLLPLTTSLRLDLLHLTLLLSQNSKIVSIFNQIPISAPCSSLYPKIRIIDYNWVTLAPNQNYSLSWHTGWITDEQTGAKKWLLPIPTNFSQIIKRVGHLFHIKVLSLTVIWYQCYGMLC